MELPFILKKNDTAAVMEKNQSVNIDYKKLGVKEAGDSHASMDSLKSNLSNLITRLRNDMANDQEKQSSFRRRVDIEIEKLWGEIEQLKITLSGLCDALKVEEEKIEAFKSDLSDIRNHPDKITTEPASKAGFIVGLVILICLSMYLFIFYSSASYSAFFKTFAINDIGVANAIFDAQAFSYAWNDGFSELILICTIPFVFMGLGYIIYMFQQQKSNLKYLKLILLFSFTFLFDALLSYQITHAIYEIERQNSFESMPPYNMSMALISPTFWIIIFSGFLVYIVWGIVFNAVMEGYSKLDRVNVALKEIEAKIKKCKTNCDKINSQKLGVESDIKRKESEIKQKDKEKESVIVDRDVISNVLSEYVSGWQTYIAQTEQSEIAIEAQKQASGVLEQIMQTV